MCECRTRASAPGRVGPAPLMPAAPDRGPHSRSRTKRRDEVKRALERTRPEREVPSGDGWGEAVVKGLRDAERRMHAIPAGTQRQLMRAQYARVKQAEQLHLAEDALAEGPELL